MKTNYHIQDQANNYFNALEQLAAYSLRARVVSQYNQLVEDDAPPIMEPVFQVSPLYVHYVILQKGCYEGSRPLQVITPFAIHSVTSCMGIVEDQPA